MQSVVLHFQLRGSASNVFVVFAVCVHGAVAHREGKQCVQCHSYCHVGRDATCSPDLLCIGSTNAASLYFCFPTVVLFPR